MYDLLSPVWRRGYRAVYRAVEHSLPKNLSSGARVLDLGCGTGANLGLLERLALDYGSYLGVDQSSAMLRQAVAKFGTLPNVRFRQLDLQAEPLPEGPFELVLSTWVLEHLADPAQVVQAAWETMSGDGVMLLLFETDMRGWRERVLGPVWRLFGAELVPHDIALGFPNILTMEHFRGPGPCVTVMTLTKQSSAGA